MTALIRAKLLNFIRNTDSAHPGLLLQRGWHEFPAQGEDESGENSKTQHIARVCDIPASDVYRRAYARWTAATDEITRFRHLTMKIEGRLLIGLATGCALETGCAISHTYGMPYIPGSSIKGAVRAYAEKCLREKPELINELFGAAPDGDEQPDLSGVIAFHDAWWIPDSGPGKPFVQDVVTTHHPEYYGSEGAHAATDLDSPVPNALVGVHGTFLFSMEGPQDWLDLAKALTEKALTDSGIGAKTAAGYGYMVHDEDAAIRLAREAEERRISKLPSGEQLTQNVKRFGLDTITRMLGADINTTKKNEKDFAAFVQEVRVQYGDAIAKWKNETKNSHKNRFKTYRIIFGAENDGNE